jgi:hypothetical protein
MCVWAVCFFVFDKDKNGYIEKVWCLLRNDSIHSLLQGCLHSYCDACLYQEELSSLVAILHEFAADLKIIQVLDNFDTNRDGKVSFGACTLTHA